MEKPSLSEPIDWAKLAELVLAELERLAAEIESMKSALKPPAAAGGDQFWAQRTISGA